MSRKLIYVSGLLACYRSHLDYTPEERGDIFADPNRYKEVVEPMDAVFREARWISSRESCCSTHLEDTTRPIFGSYHEFLGILADDESRSRLENLTEDDADKDEIYQRARGLKLLDLTEFEYISVHFPSHFEPECEAPAWERLRVILRDRE